MSIAAAAGTAFATPTGAYVGNGPPTAPSPLRPSVQQIVRNVLHADALTSPSAERAALERELDRLQPLVSAEQAAMGQQLNWTMLSQALLMNVFIVALVFGAAPVLPGKRWLLAGIALFATAVAVLFFFAYRGTRHSLRALLQRRAELEKSLDALGRQAVFAGDRITRGSSAFAARMLPLAFVAGWLAVSMYALATPSGRPTTDARVTITAPAPAAATAAGTATRPRTNPAKGSPSAAPGTAPSAPPASGPVESYSTQGETSQPAPPRTSGFKW